MKKILVFIAALSAGSVCLAQHDLGFKMGYSYLMGKYESPLSTNTVEMNSGGYSFGGYYSYTPMDNLFLSGELLISGRMWNETTIDVFEGSEVMTMNEQYTHYSNIYLEIPLSVKYGISFRRGRYGSNKYLLFYAGPSTHLLIGSSGSREETFRVDAQQQTTVLQEDIEFTKTELRDYFTPVQVGIHGGIQFAMEFGLNIDLRYQQLLMPVSVDAESFGLLRQGMATFSIGYSFLRN